MTWNQLSVSFALDTNVYFILYIGLGILAILIMLIFVAYHTGIAKLFGRHYDWTKGGIRFFTFYKMVYPWLLWGFFYGLTPILINWLMIAVVFVNKITFYEKIGDKIHFEFFERIDGLDVSIFELIE